MIPIERVQWDQSFRIIRSIYPPIDLFEDIADPADWDALASAKSKTNPRIWEQVGDLSLLPPDRRVGGPNATFLMAPFVHCSPDRPGRFSDGNYGVYYAAESEAVAIYEVAHHHGVFMSSTAQAPGWVSDFRVLIGANIDLDLHDVSGVAGILDPNSYEVSQDVGAELRRNGSNGVVYPSVRVPGGRCIGVFWPDVLEPPVQGDHYEFHYDGARVDRVRNKRTKAILQL